MQLVLVLRMYSINISLVLKTHAAFYLMPVCKYFARFSHYHSAVCIVNYSHCFVKLRWRRIRWRWQTTTTNSKIQWSKKKKNSEHFNWSSLTVSYCVCVGLSICARHIWRIRIFIIYWTTTVAGAIWVPLYWLQVIIWTKCYRRTCKLFQLWAHLMLDVTSGGKNREIPQTNETCAVIASLSTPDLLTLFKLKCLWSTRTNILSQTKYFRM